jgi:hypothetical protein
LLKKGRLAEILRMCFPKKPELASWYAGYPLTWWLLAWAEAQVTLWFWLYDVTGVVLLLWAKLALSPGLAQPPPRFGEGDRESDMVRVYKFLDGLCVGRLAHGGR